MASSLKRRLLVAALAAGALAAVASPAAQAGALSQQKALSNLGGEAAKPQREARASVLIASDAACPGQSLSAAPPAVLEAAMRCLIDFARAGSGLPGLAEGEQLAWSAQAKTSDLIRCDSFSHFACERPFSYWIKESGYVDRPCWHVGENLAWGNAENGSPRSIFRAWMASPTHRGNVLGDYGEVGIGVARGELEGRLGVQVWTSHFGTRCEAAAG